MISFLDVARFDVRDFPHVRWVLAKGIATKFAFVGSLIMPLARILLRYPHRVEIELVVVTLGEPKDSLMAAAKAAASVDSVSKGPNNAISEDEVLML